MFLYAALSIVLKVYFYTSAKLKTRSFAQIGLPSYLCL